MTSPDDVDQRSVGELLLDADVTARAALWDTNPELAPGRVRTWGEVVDATAELWAAIPHDPGDPTLRQLSTIADGIQRTHRRSGWPGAGPADPHLESVALSLSRAADLVGARRHPTGALSPDGGRDADAARTRLMHVLYMSTHSVAVTLSPHAAILQWDARRWPHASRAVHAKVARDTRARVGAVEDLARHYLSTRWPATLAHQHRDTRPGIRLEQAVAEWDLRAHRALAGTPDVATLTRIARVEQDLAVATSIVSFARSHLGQVNPENARQEQTALSNLGTAWAAFASDLTPMVGRQRNVDPQLLLAAGEVQAALRDITHDVGTLASPETIAERVDLYATHATLSRNLAAAVDLSHVLRDALDDPDLRVAARGAHLLTRTPAEASPTTAWVDAGDLQHNRPIPLPQPAHETLTRRAEHLTQTAAAANSAHTSSFDPRPLAVAHALVGRREAEQALGTGTVAYSANGPAGPRCER